MKKVFSKNVNCVIIKLNNRGEEDKDIMKNFTLCLFMLFFAVFIGMMNVNASDYVVKIGDDNYYDLASLMEAFQNTKENDQITVLQDIDLSSILPTGFRYYVPFADNVTVDLNGYSIKSNNNSITYVGNNLTVKNGKFIVNGIETGGSYSLFLGLDDQVTSGYVLENLVLEGGLNVYNAKDVVLKNVTSTGTNYYSVWAEYNSNIVIESGKFSSNGIAVFGVRNDINSDIIVNGGNIVIGDKKLYCSSSECKAPTLEGGIYDKDVSEYVADGYASKMINNNYVVGKENEVKIADVSNGKVEVDKTKAIIGETVTLTITPNEGYEVKSVKAVGTANTEVVITDGKFIMPNAEVNITVEFAKISTTVEVPVIKTEEEVKEVEIGVSDKTEVEKVLLDSLNKSEDFKDLSETESVKVAVEIAKTEISTENENKINEVVKVKYENIVVSEYFDITVSVKNSNNEELGVLSELTDKIQLVVALSEDLKKVENGKSRNYYVIRQHGDEIEIIDDVKVSEDGKSLVFTTNKFSTYAIAYEDVNVTNPETLDNVSTYALLGGLAIIGIVGAVTLINKKKLFK